MSIRAEDTLRRAEEQFSAARVNLQHAQQAVMEQEWMDTFPPTKNIYQPKSEVEREQIRKLLLPKARPGDLEIFTARFNYITSLVSQDMWGLYARPDWSHHARQVGISIDQEHTLVVRIGELDEGYGITREEFEIFDMNPSQPPKNYSELERAQVFVFGAYMGQQPQAKQIHDFYRGTSK